MPLLFPNSGKFTFGHLYQIKVSRTHPLLMVVNTQPSHTQWNLAGSYIHLLKILTLHSCYSASNADTSSFDFDKLHDKLWGVVQ